MTFWKNKKYIITCVVIIIGIMILIYSYWVYDTSSIMDEINRVAQGKGAVDVTNHQILMKRMPFKDEGENLRVSKISRVFTWCHSNKGKIWVRYKIIYKYGTGIKMETICDTVFIEKKDNKWEVVKYISPW